MPKGPKGQKRRVDVVSNAIKVAKVATGEEESEKAPEKDAAAQSMGKRGGAARAKKLTPEQRSEIARKAAAKRWGKG